MLNKLTLVGVALMVLLNSSDSDAFLVESLHDVFQYVNPFRSSSSAMGEDRDEDVHYRLDDVRDDLSIQTVMLKIRLKAAKHFIRERNQFLKHTEEKNWRINETILNQKRKDVETARKDVTIIEEALRNPTEFNDVTTLGPHKNGKSD